MLRNILENAGWQGLTLSVVSIAASAAAPTRTKPDFQPTGCDSESGGTDLTSLRRLAGNADYDAFRQAWPAALAGCDNDASQLELHVLVAETELAAGDHQRLGEATTVLIGEFDAREGHYYQARSEFLHGRYDAAIERLQCVAYRHPDYIEAARLLAKSFRDAGQIEAAWRSLEALLPRCDDINVWSAMAGLVQSQADFIRMLNHFKRRQVSQDSNADTASNTPEKSPLEYLALGALRSGNFTLAKWIWEDLLRSIAVSPPELRRSQPDPKPKVAEYSSRRAELALIDLKRTLEAADISMFLVSGTLLGFVREGRLLGHDHDVDVGVWDDVDRERLLSIVRKAGLFYDQASRTREIVRVKHVNGIVIDIFYHFRSPGDYWHRGVKIIWHNSPFGLVRRKFLGENFLIPDDHDKYLTENYGDWRTPKIDFDCAFDTPNAEVANHDELLIHTYRMLNQALVTGARGRASFFLGKLRELGRDKFVDDICNQLQGGHIS
ncbi:MAG: hypothetical protein OEN50_02100 [Deltaproteobacteria bacterium]|nr:hypothetical protein [Deltaproteobacteria bacterium]